MRLSYLKSEHNRLWIELEVLNKKFKNVSHAGELPYLRLKKADIVNKLNELEGAIKDFKEYHKKS